MLFRSEEIVDIVDQMVNDKQKRSIVDRADTDFSFLTKRGYRHRVNVYFQRGSTAIAIRLLRNDIPTLEDLFMPPIMADFAMRPRGLVLPLIWYIVAGSIYGCFIAWHYKGIYLI